MMNIGFFPTFLPHFPYRDAQQLYNTRSDSECQQFFQKKLQLFKKPPRRSILLRGGIAFMKFSARQRLLLVCSSQLSSNSLVALSLTALQILADFRETGTSRDQLTDDDVLLQTSQRIDLALDGGFG